MIRVNNQHFKCQLIKASVQVVPLYGAVYDLRFFVSDSTRLVCSPVMKVLPVIRSRAFVGCEHSFSCTMMYYEYFNW